MEFSLHSKYNDSIMKKTLMIGPSYVDINAKVRQLPKGNEDMDILSTSQKISGSGYVCANVFEKLGMDYELISPVGEGVYGDAVKKQALEDHIALQYVDEMMNGCTYTLHDLHDETSRFIMPGAEYYYSRYFVDDYSADEIRSVCVFGDMLTLDTQCTSELVETLEDLKKTIYFVPNGCSQNIEQEVLEAIYSFHPVLYLMDTEAYYLANEYSGELRDTARHLYEKTNAMVMIVKQGEGVFVYDGEESYLAPCKEKIEYDMHLALFLVAKQCGIDTKNALMFACAYPNDTSFDQDMIEERLKELVMVK